MDQVQVKAAEKAYWSGKRRYAMYIVNKEGISIEELEMKGMDIMKSNFPPLFRNFGENLIKNILFGKQYYVDQQNFFSQGKFEVKTTLASSPLILLTGTGLSGSVPGVTPPPPVTSYSYVIGPSGWGGDLAACSNTYYYPTVVYANTNNPLAVTELYTDSALTVPFDGGYQYWKWGLPYLYTKYSSFIDFAGGVQSTITCP